LSPASVEQEPTQLCLIAIFTSAYQLASVDRHLK
jgi:hypothetical protein